MWRRTLFVLALFLAATSLALGDSLIATFDLDPSGNFIGGDHGQITLTLSGGVIDASVLTADGPIYEVGINSLLPWPEVLPGDFSVTSPVSSAFTTYQTGIICNLSPTSCPTSVSWTITNPLDPVNGFTSVYDIFNLFGKGTALTDFYLAVITGPTSAVDYGADAVPEPGTVALTGAGLLAALAAFRRRRAV